MKVAIYLPVPLSGGEDWLCRHERIDGQSRNDWSRKTDALWMSLDDALPIIRELAGVWNGSAGARAYIEFESGERMSLQMFS